MHQSADVLRLRPTRVDGLTRTSLPNPSEAANATPATADGEREQVPLLVGVLNGAMVFMAVPR